MRYSLLTFASVFVLWALVSELNHALTGWGIYLWLGGLYVTQAALDLPLRSGIAGSLLAGMLFDALAPVAFGTHALWFAAGHAAIFHLRDRVPRDETAARVVVALFANLALFLVFSFVHSRHLPDPGAVWPRILLDLLCSQLVIAVAAPWFFALQKHMLELPTAIHAVARRRFR